MILLRCAEERLLNTNVIPAGSSPSKLDRFGRKTCFPCEKSNKLQDRVFSKNVGSYSEVVGPLVLLSKIALSQKNLMFIFQIIESNSLMSYFPLQSVFIIEQSFFLSENPVMRCVLLMVVGALPGSCSRSKASGLRPKVKIGQAAPSKFPRQGRRKEAVKYQRNSCCIILKTGSFKELRQCLISKDVGKIPTQRTGLVLRPA